MSGLVVCPHCLPLTAQFEVPRYEPCAKIQPLPESTHEREQLINVLTIIMMIVVVKITKLKGEEEGGE